MEKMVQIICSKNPNCCLETSPTPINLKVIPFIWILLASEWLHIGSQPRTKINTNWPAELCGKHLPQQCKWSFLKWLWAFFLGGKEGRRTSLESTVYILFWAWEVASSFLYVTPHKFWLRKACVYGQLSPSPLLSTTKECNNKTASVMMDHSVGYVNIDYLQQ